jgi:hypothetical protein
LIAAKNAARLCRCPHPVAILRFSCWRHGSHAIDTDAKTLLSCLTRVRSLCWPLLFERANPAPPPAAAPSPMAQS